MAAPTFVILGSVVAVSLLALIGIVTLGMREEVLQRVLLYLVSFAAGGLFGDAFLHLLPETAAQFGFDHVTGVYLLSGVVLSFGVEKYIHWHHHHFEQDDCEDCIEPFSYMILFGDAVHNFIDGIVIAASYLASFPAGVATTFAVGLHEIPQEIGDFGVLVHGGFSKRQALLANFLTALTAVFGAVLVILLAGQTGQLVGVLLPFSAGGFIYIAGSDLLPEVKEEKRVTVSTLHIAAFVTGIALMYGLTFIK